MRRSLIGAQFRRTKGAVKLHLLLDHEGHRRAFAVVTEGKQHEVRVARQLEFAAGTILAIDRGYCDYEWFADLTQQGVCFVTRLETMPTMRWWKSANDHSVRACDEIRSSSSTSWRKREVLFRRVEYYDEERDEVLVFLTNV